MGERRASDLKTARAILSLAPLAWILERVDYVAMLRRIGMSDVAGHLSLIFARQ